MNCNIYTYFEQINVWNKVARTDLQETIPLKVQRCQPRRDLLSVFVLTPHADLKAHSHLVLLQMGICLLLVPFRSFSLANHHSLILVAQADVFRWWWAVFWGGWGALEIRVPAKSKYTSHLSNCAIKHRKNSKVLQTRPGNLHKPRCARRCCFDLSL